MLNAAIRDFTRRLFGGQRMTVDDLHRTVDELEETPGKIDRYVSGTIGIAEGISHRVRNLPDESVVNKVGRAERKAANYLAIAGAISPPDPKELDATIDAVVAQAKANEYRPGFPTLDQLAAMCNGLIGLNSGDDRIVEVRLKQTTDFEIHAFDQKGYHVLEAYLSKHSPGVLYIDALRASHGRNCDDLGLDFGGVSVPGRGNALAIAAGLEAMITECVKHGIHTIATNPGSPMVASLYMKMGFTAPGSDERFEKRRLEWLLEQFPILAEAVQTRMLIRKADAETHVQKLDLTHPEAVRQALASFRLSRAALRDVPKDVAKRLIAMGEQVPDPNYAQWTKELSNERKNVRVIR